VDAALRSLAVIHKLEATSLDAEQAVDLAELRLPTQSALCLAASIRKLLRHLQAKELPAAAAQFSKAVAQLQRVADDDFPASHTTELLLRTGKAARLFDRPQAKTDAPLDSEFKSLSLKQLEAVINAAESNDLDHNGRGQALYLAVAECAAVACIESRL
jgi:hypothetical protein